jgi:hypothetical protein
MIENNNIEIIPAKCNQNNCENHFSVIRKDGGLNSNPTVSQYRSNNSWISLIKFKKVENGYDYIETNHLNKLNIYKKEKEKIIYPLNVILGISSRYQYILNNFVFIEDKNVQNTIYYTS